mgnify:CR=1 FL=1
MSKRVLLCDDELHILRAAEFKLRKAGYDVQCASDGQEAWENILAGRPDMLITDLQMPRLTGLELARRVREHEATRDLPIVMLTAKGYELSEHQMAEKCGFTAVCNKPFSPRALLQLVQETLSDSSQTATPSA